MTRSFNGRHMAAILVAFFGTVILVNVTMASYATGTFSGVVVKNSYVASQEYNRWLDQAEASRALGWEAKVERRSDGRLAVILTGAENPELSIEARHPLGREPDRNLTFEPLGQGRFLSHDVLPGGRWTLRMTARQGQQVWRHQEELR